MGNVQKTIVHIIDSLGMGGAEMLLVGSINGLPEYRHIIITLYPINEFEKIECEKIYCLHHQGNSSLLSSIRKCKKILKKYKPSVIHSHLYWSTIIARFSKNNQSRLVSTYHSLLYAKSNKSQFSKKMLLLDRITYKKRFYTLFISEKVKENICAVLPINENKSVLHNYVEDHFFEQNYNYQNFPKPLKIISVGNLRAEKNYKFILQCFSKLKHLPIHLDIYGDGKERESLEKIIQSKQLTNVSLKGKTHDLGVLLPTYNLFLMGSTFEGFGIALLEAMAVGLPCMSSNIDAFKEVTQNKAIFFNPTNEQNFIQVITAITKGELDLKTQGKEMKKIATKYTKSLYISKIRDIYEN